MARSPNTREERRREEAQKKVQTRPDLDALCAKGDWESAAYLARYAYLSAEMPVMLYAAWRQGRITVDKLLPAIQAIWVHNRHPVPPIGERAWMRMFKAAKAAGFTGISENVTRENKRIVPAFEHLAEQPTAVLTIWRGAGLATNGRGMSSTVHRKLAVQFAEEYAAEGREQAVWKATIPPGAVLARFGDEREQEVVVNPNMLRDRVSLDQRITEQVDHEHRARLQRIISGA